MERQKQRMARSLKHGPLALKTRMRSRSLILALLDGAGRGQGVKRIGVEVGAQLVRRDAIFKEFRDGQHNFRRWHFDLHRIKPAPHMHLAHL